MTHEVKIEMNWKTILGAGASIITLVGLLIGGVYAAEERYVSQSELDNSKMMLAGDISSLQYSMQQQRIEDRIQDYRDDANYINDKIVDGTATPTDRKRLNRYNNSIDSLEREMDRLESK